MGKQKQKKNTGTNLYRNDNRGKKKEDFIKYKVRKVEPQGNLFCLYNPNKSYVFYHEDALEKEDCFNCTTDLEFVLVDNKDIDKYERIMKENIVNDIRAFSGEFSEFGYALYNFGEKTMIVNFSAGNEFYPPFQRIKDDVVKRFFVPNASKENCRRVMTKEVFSLLESLFIN